MVVKRSTLTHTGLLRSYWPIARKDAMIDDNCQAASNSLAKQSHQKKLNQASIRGCGCHNYSNLVGYPRQTYLLHLQCTPAAAAALANLAQWEALPVGSKMCHVRTDSTLKCCLVPLWQASKPAQLGLAQHAGCLW